MKALRPVLAALADFYEEREAGRTGLGTLDVQIQLDDLLARARCEEGDARELAERHLREAAAKGLITLEPLHKRDPNCIHKVRLAPAREGEFYAWLGRPTPTAIREEWSRLFQEAEGWTVSPDFTQEWRAFCQARAGQARQWQNMGEFRRTELAKGRELLLIVSRLLAWTEKGVYLRVASCRVCGDSKKLERRRGTVEKLLAAASAGRYQSLADLKILDTPSHVWVSGSLKLRVTERVIDCSSFQEGTTISESDILAGEAVCSAQRCLTIENKTSFHQRARRRPDELLIHTSYPNSATLALLRKLPPAIECCHWGDTDPAGFDILRELREASGRAITALGMSYKPCATSRALSDEEKKLLQKLLQSPSLAAERATLEAMLQHGRKGAFEQEHFLLEES